ncbi:MAG: hypothetical protein KKD39_01310 [Candidatus Altiarchaeota archaeon]|nr:hypothetical protein [Candidatus Altiarchaeota archaeon]
MVQPSKRTRSKKKIKVKTPGGKNVTHFRLGKAKKKKSAIYGKPLSGVVSGTATKMRNTVKSGKIPKRPYAGVLNPQELDQLIRYVVRTEAKYGSKELKDLNLPRNLILEKYLPRGWFEKATAGEVLKKTITANPVKKPKGEEKKKPKVKKAAK